MNRVLTAERLSQAQLVEARTKAEREAIEARSSAEVERMAAQSQAAVQNIRAEADAATLRVQAEAGAAYTTNPALLRIRELEALSALSANPAARIYIGFDKHLDRPQHAGD
jgi:regulator of protease activity HflC (stomatin/prohibitin superfamily)